MLSPPLHLNSFHRCDDLHRNKNKKEGGGGTASPQSTAVSQTCSQKEGGRLAIRHLCLFSTRYTFLWRLHLLNTKE